MRQFSFLILKYRQFLQLFEYVVNYHYFYDCLNVFVHCSSWGLTSQILLLLYSKILLQGPITHAQQSFIPITWGWNKNIPPVLYLI